jgi:hypothetical protein
MFVWPLSATRTTFRTDTHTDYCLYGADAHLDRDQPDAGLDADACGRAVGSGIHIALGTYSMKPPSARSAC